MSVQPQETEGVLGDIFAQIDKQGGPLEDWYAGIAEDWEDRLFVDHKVPKKDHWRIVRRCHNETDARMVEKALLEKGCDGGGGGGTLATVFVYAYLKKPGVTDP